MHPLLLRAIIEAPRYIKDAWNRPPRRELERRAAEIKIKLEIGNERRKLQKAQVSREANVAYEKGMNYWKGGMFSRSNKEKAEKYIRLAAQGGHLEAQMMARMHGIEF